MIYNFLAIGKPVRVIGNYKQRQGATNKNFNWANVIERQLFLYYEESLVSSNLNSKQHRFHGAHPNVHMCLCSVNIVSGRENM